MLERFRCDVAALAEGFVPQNNLDWVTPHVFRKTVATLIERETDSVTATKFLGHADDKVTREHYIERRPNVAPDVSEILQHHGPDSPFQASSR